MVYLTLLAGLVVLAVGGDILIRGAVSLAKALNLSPLLIGLTVVAFGTSAPELVASLRAAQLGAPGIVIGNILGSNIANILLILGIAALIAPMQADKRGFKRDAIALTASALFCAVAVVMGVADRMWGVVALVALVTYIIVAYRTGHGFPAGEGVLETEARFASKFFGLRVALIVDSMIAFAGMVMLALGGDLLVRSSVQIARDLGLTETFIGLTIVALGTSAPELVVSTLAALKRQTDVAVGNIIGSNIFNVLAILGITSVIIPIPIDGGVGMFDIWVMLAATALLVRVAATDYKIERTEGIVLLAGYAAYIAIKLIFFL